MSEANSREDNDVTKRAEKRRQMRASLSSGFSDGISHYQTPMAARKRSESINENSQQLERQMRYLSMSSNESVGQDGARSEKYLNDVETFLKDFSEHEQKVRKLMKGAIAALDVGDKEERKELKEAMKSMDDIGEKLLRDRAALAVGKARIRLSMSSRPPKMKLSEAYLMALTENFPAPSDAKLKKMGRDRTAQSDFRRRLIKLYHPGGAALLDLPEKEQGDPMWCPISQQYFLVKDLRAAHIVPHCVGEENLAYIFGKDISAGHEVMWADGNGFMLHEWVEELLDKAAMVIIPDPSDTNELMSVILSKRVLREKTYAGFNKPFSSFHMQRLQFVTDARPSRRYLYMHALLTVFRRRRFQSPGWQGDNELVFNGKIWGSPDIWLRKSMVRALAQEVGDIWEVDDDMRGLAEFPNGMTANEEQKHALLIRSRLSSPCPDEKYRDEEEDWNEDLATDQQRDQDC